MGARPTSERRLCARQPRKSARQTPSAVSGLRGAAQLARAYALAARFARRLLPPRVGQPFFDLVPQPVAIRDKYSLRVHHLHQ
jgi:hypothetical protein